MAARTEETGAARDLGIKAAKSTTIYTIGNIIGSLAVLFLLIILARLLSPSDFGLYAIAIAFYNILAGQFVFGTALRKEIPQTRDNAKRVAELISNGYAIALCISLIVSIAAILLGHTIAIYIYHNAAMTRQLMLAGFLVLFYTLFNITLATLVAIDKTKKGTIIYLVYAFTQLIAATALVIAGYGIFGAIAGMGIGLIIASVMGTYWISKYIKGKFTRPNKKTMKHLFNFSIPVLVSNLALFAPPNLAILLLGVYVSPITVGSYNAAYRFGNFVNVILVSIGFILLPAFAKAFSDKNMASKIGKIYNSSIYYTLLFLLPILIYVVSVSHPLVYLLFSSSYKMAPYYFAVITLGSAMGIISVYASNLQVGYGDTKTFMYYQLLAVAIQVALLFSLTPIFGVNGVLLALFIVSQIVVDVIYVYALYRQFKFKHHFGQVARLIASSMALLLLLYMLTVFLHYSKIALATNLLAVLVIFPPLAAISGGIKAENIKFVRDIAKSMNVDFIAKYILDYAQFFIREKH